MGSKFWHPEMGANFICAKIYELPAALLSKAAGRSHGASE